MNDDEILAERNRLLDSWEAAAPGWGRQADRMTAAAMPISQWLIDHADPRPGERVLELAAGPGDTGFMAAARIRPGGTLICSDGTEGMLSVARERAREQGIDNVEFKQLALEWIDLPTAAVDVILCRWGVMLTLDPATVLHECRRVLKPGGRFALAVWDTPAKNPWVMIGQDALVACSLAEPPAPPAPGVPSMFALSRPGLLAEMLAEAGFAEVLVEPIGIVRSFDSIVDYIGETRDLSRGFATIWAELDDAGRGRLRDEIARRAAPFADSSGALTLAGSSLGGLGHA